MADFRSNFESHLLDLFPAHAVILDADGRIVTVNRAWKLFASQNGLNDPEFCVGKSYLEECDRASQRGARGAAAVAKGLRRLLDGTAEAFRFTYRCPAPAELRLFQIVAAPLGGNPVEGLLMLHINLTHQRLLAERFHRRRDHSDNRVVVCAWCRRIRNKEKWMTLEDYFVARYQFAFSHGICPDCQRAFRV